MNKLEEILKYNKEFVENKEYEKYETSNMPKKKILILSCMDTRLTDLLPKALNLKNGDAKVVKNAGAIISNPFGSIMRSIIVAIYEFNVDEIFVIAHHRCGMCNLATNKLLEKIIDRGIKKETIDTLYNGGINVERWLHGFDTVEESIEDSVNLIKKHPLIPEGISVHGLAIDPKTGSLDVIINGYNK